jgi:hypothetical protein
MLKDIIAELSAEHSLDIVTPKERELQLRRINRAALYIYDLGDIWNVTDEEVFNFNTATSQVTLPEYVGQVRGARYYDIRYKVPLDAMGNRYNTGMGNELWYLNLREKSANPLSQNINNQSILRLSIPLVETTDIVVDITGPTSLSARITDSITITAGNLTADGIQNFKSPIYSIRKNRKTLYDITIKDVEDNILATIPNNQYLSRFHVYQVIDDNFSFASTATDLAIEVMFKKRFTPYIDDSDIFVAGEEYEDAIIKLFAADRAKDIDIRNALYKEAMARVSNLHKDHDAGKIKRLTFGLNPFFNQDYQPLSEECS